MTVTSSDPPAGHRTSAAVQHRLGCDTSRCAVRQAALAVLVAAGHYQLAPDPVRSRPVTAQPHRDEIRRDRT